MMKNENAGIFLNVRNISLVPPHCLIHCKDNKLLTLSINHQIKTLQEKQSNSWNLLVEAF